MQQRQYMLVRPENRLVADNLERQWNQKLTELAEAEEQYRQTSKADGIAVSAEDRARIQSLVSDLPRVWNDPRTPSRERKRLLRFLVDDVTLLRARDDSDPNPLERWSHHAYWSAPSRWLLRI